VAMKLHTRVFELYKGKYGSLPKLARAMEISTSQIYRVKEGKRRISEKFIIGVTKAFPEYNLDDLFYSQEKDIMTTASNRNEFGKTLKQQRQMAELTLSQLAAKSGVSASHLGRIERGERFPSGHILRKIARPLGFDESLLLTTAGYLSPGSENSEEHRIYRGLDHYVAKVLSEEPVEVQRAVIGILSVLKSIAKTVK